jgi:hypothetical protein
MPIVTSVPIVIPQILAIIRPAAARPRPLFRRRW